MQWHYALLCGLSEMNQPVSEITNLLAAVDNATVAVVIVKDPVLGYRPPAVSFPLPKAGDFYQTAKTRAVLKPNRRVLRIDFLNHGFGYSKPPEETARLSLTNVGGNQNYEAAATYVIIFRSGVNRKEIERTQLDYLGSEYTENETDPELYPTVGGVATVQKLFWSMRLASIL
jgi:hypothetical protein